MNSARRFRPAVAGLEGRQLMASNALATVVTFNNANLANISGLTQDAQGNLYGTTSSNGQGTGREDASVFEIAPGSKAATTLASFNGTKGFDLGGVTQDVQGNLYGTTIAGGANGDGIVFEIPRGSQTVVPLVAFGGGLDGKYPVGVTVDGQGNLYGTTERGGANGDGTVFEVAAGSDAVTTLASFNDDQTQAGGVVVDGQGNVYGTTRAGGLDGGTGSVYEVARGSNALTTLAAFDGLNGSGLSGLTMDAQGNLFGTSTGGGAASDGMVFEIEHGSNVFDRIASFHGADGSTPDPGVGVVEDALGNLYGTTEAGGQANGTGDGTVFKIAAGSHTITTLTSFSGIDGSLIKGLTLDGQGDALLTANPASNGSAKVYRLKIS